MSLPTLRTDLLEPWMTRQRWYAAKGSEPALTEIGAWELTTDDPDARAVVHLVLDETAGKPTLYQVPLVYRGTALGLPGPGVWDGVHVVDAPHDPAFTAALLRVIRSGGRLEGDRAWAEGSPVGDAVAGDYRSRVLGGEQSNTSIVFEADAAPPLIVKLFRALHDGANPDVELQTAIAEAGGTGVPRPVGAITADWSDTGTQSGRARGHVAFAQEFLPGSEDAWQVALEVARSNEPFTAQSEQLGRTTALIHSALASALGTQPPSEQQIASSVAQMRGRLALAVAEVPALAELGDAASAVIDAAADAEWPAQQRVHGDLHLGQILSAGDRGWVFVDFEGEPLRPMHERVLPDSPWRDVAGMLRSLDYVAGAVPSATEHTAQARAAYLAGYRSAAGIDPTGAVLDAFELDKALYEVVYEARNRPDWLAIPLGAVARLTAR